MDNGTSFGPEGDNRGSDLEFQFFDGPPLWDVAHFDGHPVLTATVNGTTYVESVGLCGVLLHSNPRKAVADWTTPAQRITLNVREAGSVLPGYGTSRAGGNPNRTFLTREGANRLLMKSKAPGANRVHEWLADDVMPSIDDKGSYTAPGKVAAPGAFIPDLTNMDPTVLALIAQLGQAVTAASQDALEQRKRNAELEPAAALAETYAGAGGVVTVRTFARNVQQWAQPRGIKVLQDQVFDFLGYIGMIIRANTSEKGQATAHALKVGWCENNTKDYETKTRGMLLTTYARLTQKGVDHAWKRVYAALGEHGTLDLAVINPPRPRRSIE
ncbi:phage antirepressor KilAC domain-containing protein [Streptosporangium vulgare]|uniref:Phage antirepressor KilAC domain-containing protein n=1 Tax=Streptosporangium vulgare TaxID=46190 RepID=A0ABV5TQ31_9ACTN